MSGYDEGILCLRRPVQTAEKNAAAIKSIVDRGWKRMGKAFAYEDHNGCCSKKDRYVRLFFFIDGNFVFSGCAKRYLCNNTQPRYDAGFYVCHRWYEHSEHCS